jgi:hypothetical protein
MRWTESPSVEELTYEAGPRSVVVLWTPTDDEKTPIA